MSKNGKFFDLLAVRVAGGETIADAAKEIHCSRSHAYTLSGNPEFRQRVAEIRTAAVAAAVGRLSDAACQAVATLRELLDAANEPSIRLNASKAILAALPTMTEFGELRKRIDDLERSPLRVAR
jgi:hypothetical protein